jgi:type IV secretory pathway VirB10-like protein
MNSRSLAGLLVLGCVTAATGGAYVAVRQNAATQPPVVAPAAPATAVPAPDTPVPQPVSETEAVIEAPVPATPAISPSPAPPAAVRSAVPVRPQPRRTGPVTRPAPAADARASARGSAGANDRQAPSAATTKPAATAVSAPDRPGVVEVPAATAAVEPVPEPARAPEPPPAPPEPQFEEVVLPASSVVGLQVETPLSTERARIEDRVEARVTRDVSTAGRIAIPAGSRVMGSVTLVERGGKMKDRARLGVRFHTLVLANGREVPLRTEAIFREGDSPSNESARKIGGAAIGGAILGAIMGGGKGAVVGGAAGAAGGSAAVMAGDRNAATLPAGTVVTVRLSAPATIEVEKQ